MDPLRPLDIVVLTGLLAWPDAPTWSMAALGARLHLPTTSTFRALGRLTGAGLIDAHRRADRAAALELLVHGVRWVFPAALGAPARGLPTARSGPGLVDLLPAQAPLVWAHPDGPATGTTLAPLHACLPPAAADSPPLYRLASLVEALRIGNPRERALAERILRATLGLR